MDNSTVAPRLEMDLASFPALKRPGYDQSSLRD
jgi:hypothetical protein